MGNRKALKGDGETLKNDRATLNGRKEVLKGVEDALKDDKKWSKGDVGIIVLLYQYVHVKVDIFLYILFR